MKIKLIVLLSWTLIISSNRTQLPIVGFTSKATCKIAGETLKNSERNSAWNWADYYICVEVK